MSNYRKNDLLKSFADETNFIEYLNSLNLRKVTISGKNNPVIKNGSFVKKITNPEIKNLVMSNLRNFKSTSGTKISPKKALIQNHKKLFTDSLFDFLENIEVDDSQDNINCSYFPFRNCLVKVGMAGITTINYGDCEHIFWESEVIPFNYIEDSSKSVFSKFIENICNNEHERINAIGSAMGYLLHKYKDPSRPVAIILMDEKISNSPDGRTGKGIISKAVGQMRQSLIYDFKNTNMNDKFAFQSVDLNTDLIVFDDIRKGFRFDRLFSMITEGMKSEQKYEHEVKLSYKNSPKILITTNFALLGSGESAKDRQFIFELSDYYSATHKPIDDFKERFFDEWDNAEHNRFFNFMLSCVRYYLSHGLVRYNYINLEKKQLINATSLEFSEFVESNVKLGEKYSAQKLYTLYKSEYSADEHTTLIGFSKWFRSYAEIKQLNLKRIKSHGARYLILSKN
ncbi:MAG: hypothetical protein K9J12_03250 [Melioribacteraceae bacterium]|nr:hypothetical protein [Melioribacteraceae bacterium]MCF8265239.1 hypothetical protein [Melioribacteraceae bacterium]MCF8413012.1 hypothetical protein [Melioribacteraceae bacterium]MCF8432715.1 hypothetical protein [Melioribacteraceae bacterium]